MTLAGQLPAFTWDRIAPLGEKARQHPDGAVDLSMGTPVDPVPSVIRSALAAASDAPGYPLTRGVLPLRAAAAGWLERSLAVSVPPDDVLPVIGTKEFIAWLPVMLGLGPGDVVVYPELAYPTYDIGARLAGAVSMASDGLLSLGPAPVRLVWINSPSNPTGRVLPVSHLRKVVAWARERGAVVASDECYITLGWDVSPVSVLHPSVCGGSFDGLLGVYSMSKRSNLAGYRAGFVTGDPALVAALLAVRKQAGMIVPAPVQAALTAALSDDAHAVVQRERYAARRSALREAFTGAGWSVDHSEAGLYLWLTHPSYDGWSAAELLAADYGILVTPGPVYGPSGARHVRVALTATDERVAAAAARLASLSCRRAEEALVDDDETTVSYQGVTPGVPVLTRDGDQFGILEHVLEVPELDVFDGIVVWVGHGGLAEWRIQRDLSSGHHTAARFLEIISHSGDLRFVDADQVAAITSAAIRCDLDRSDVARLPKPQGGTPAYYANAIDQAQPLSMPYRSRQYGRLFGRTHWRQEQ